MTVLRFDGLMLRDRWDTPRAARAREASRIAKCDETKLCDDETCISCAMLRYVSGESK